MIKQITFFPTVDADKSDVKLIVEAPPKNKILEDYEPE